MHDAFEPVPILEKLPLQIDCLAAWGEPRASGQGGGGPSRLAGGEASDRVGGLSSQAVREGRDDRTVHQGGLRDL